MTSISSREPVRIGFLVFPFVTQLDFTGPAQVFASLTEVELFFVWKSLDPLPTDSGFSILPNASFKSCPPLDVLCIPGGPGQVSIMKDPEVLEWTRCQGEAAQFVTSVCSGSLLLGAAGLLKGYRATAHWAVRKHLSKYGATPDAARVAIDRNRITGGGVTAGIDFALELVAHLRGAGAAEAIQLMLEYDPAPPFDAGSISKASPELVAAAESLLAALQANADRQLKRVEDPTGIEC